MSEIQTTVIDILTAEILILKQQTAQSMIEIGKKLIVVKESLPHGNFGDYLKEKVGFSRQSANRFMQVAREFSNCSALGNIEPTKVYALLDIPSEEREDFISEAHEVNGEIKKIDEMTTRELQKVIKEKQDLEAKLKDSTELNKKAHELASLRGKERDDALRTLEDAKKIAIEKSEETKDLEAALQKEKDKLKKEKENSKIELAKIQTFIGEAKTSGDDEEVLRLQASLQELQNDVDSSAKIIDELEAKLKDKPIDVITAEPVIIEKVPEEVEKELQELRRKDSQNSDQSVVRFKKYYEELQNTFTAQLELIDEMKDANPENHEKFKNAISKLLSKMAERV